MSSLVGRERGRAFLETTPAMQQHSRGNQLPGREGGSREMNIISQYNELMGGVKHLWMCLSNLVSYVVVWLYWLVVKKGDAVIDKNSNQDAKPPSQIKQCEYLRDIETKVAPLGDQAPEDSGVADCPLTPVITRQDAMPVSRRVSPASRKSEDESPIVENTVDRDVNSKKENEFVMVEYRDGSETVGYRDGKPPLDSPRTLYKSTSSLDTECSKNSTYLENREGQHYVVVEVPRDDSDTNIKRKRKKKKRTKEQKDEHVNQNEHAGSPNQHHDTKFAPAHGYSIISTEPATSPGSQNITACDISVERQSRFLKGSSTNSTTVPISNNKVFDKEHTPESAGMSMGEHHHESELDKAWKTASLSAAKLGLDTFGEDRSLSSHHLDGSESMNSSRLSHISWAASMDSSLSFGSSLQSTSDRKSSSFMNIKDIWDKAT